MTPHEPIALPHRRRPGPSAVRIVSVFPELLGTYGDGGNVQVLERRLAWRGRAVEVEVVPLSSAVPDGGDLYVLGGGEDSAQVLALEALRDGALTRAAGAGALVFGVCAGLQLLGHSFTGADGVQRDGLGLLDAVTTRLAHRVVGDVVADVDRSLGLPPLNGFANHGGGTALGPLAVPLAVTTSGRGNDGSTGGGEGALQGAVVATYLHGPVLARNPALADWLLSRVVDDPLEPLPPGVAEALHRERTGRA